MTQLWIMSADAAPNEALKTGADIAVCGACPLRGKTCYVEIGKAPRSVWLAGNSGKYRTLANAKEAQRLLIGLKPMRLGAYGDPAALPEAVIKELADLSHGNYTGYTHQWRDPENRWL
ncbi:MAG: hypothetical protein RR091_10835 [Cloacibacillus sp.]